MNAIAQITAIAPSHSGRGPDGPAAASDDFPVHQRHTFEIDSLDLVSAGNRRGFSLGSFYAVIEFDRWGSWRIAKLYDSALVQMADSTKRIISGTVELARNSPLWNAIDAVIEDQYGEMFMRWFDSQNERTYGDENREHRLTAIDLGVGRFNR